MWSRRAQLIVIVDYKTANLGSWINILKRLGLPSRVAETPAQLTGASRIILPGIGHFDTCAENLRKAGFVDALEDLVLSGPRVPLLGVCVGAQLLTRGSEEGTQPGLGWIPAETKRFPSQVAGEAYRVPHMGWNVVAPSLDHSLLTQYAERSLRFYFVHSYYITCDHQRYQLARTHHGIDFDSAIVRDNIAGVQFHPEKSHRFGMQLMRNFANSWNPTIPDSAC